MGKIIVITGNIGSGKSTLRKALADYYSQIGALSVTEHGSDDIREELHGRRGGNSKGVFHAMHERTLKDLKKGTALVLLDSTGMSPRFREMIEEYRKSNSVFLVKLHCDADAWKKREGIRTDRTDLDEKGQPTTFIMPYRAYEDSSKIQDAIKADLEINTTNVTPDEVLQTVLSGVPFFEKITVR